ncbi:MAG: hypothetical protein ACYDCN_04885 [Bacteroidia bacterium]
MLDKATRKLISDELDKESYIRIKDSLQKETIDLKVRISDLKDTESGFMEYLTYGVTLLGNLPHYYSTATLEGKQKMLGSIFPEKLIFSENSYRTAKPNEVIELFSDVTKAFGDSEKKKAAKNSGLFHKVVSIGIYLTSCFSLL